jgi:ankyrin repeat protein
METSASASEPMPTDRDAIGRSALHLAVLHGDRARAMLYLNHSNAKESANAVDKHNLSVLEYACWRGEADLVAELLKRGANARHVDDFGVSPILKAVAYHHHRCVRLLLDFDPALVSMRQGPIRAPPEYEAVSLVDTALHVASRHGDTPMVKLLLARNADVAAENVRGETPLVLAIQRAPSIFATLRMPDANRPTFLQRIGLRSKQNAKQLELFARSSSWGTVDALLNATLDASPNRTIDSTVLERGRFSVRWAIRFGLVGKIAEMRKATGLE